MNDKNYLVYFLNSMKDELGFENPEDFKNKVESNLDFKIKMQKFVFLAKYFGWDNSYSYNIYIHGPYSPVLADDYYSNDLFEYTPLKISDFDFDSLKSFIKGKTIKYLESATTILLYKNFNGNISLDTAIEKLGDINFEELENLDNNQQEYLQDILDFLAKGLVNHILKMDKLIK